MGYPEDIGNEFLIEECRKGNKHAQRKVYELYAGAMLGSSLRITGNQMDAEDITQESFVIAFTKIKLLDENKAFGSWLKRIVINKSINHVKRQKLTFEEEYKIELEDEIYTEPQYTVEMIQRALEHLSQGYKIVFCLYAFEGYSHKEISNHLGITESTSKSQYKRAKQRIKELIIETYG